MDINEIKTLTQAHIDEVERRFSSINEKADRRDKMKQILQKVQSPSNPSDAEILNYMNKLLGKDALKHQINMFYPKGIQELDDKITSRTSDLKLFIK